MARVDVYPGDVMALPSLRAEATIGSRVLVPGGVRSYVAIACAIGAIACVGAPASDDATAACGDDALSACSARTKDDAFYVDQGQRYFDSLDASADPTSLPTYAPLVARWEWPPWLKLTGYGRDMIPAVDRLVLVAYPDTTVPDRDCRAFDVQPFARCHVSLDYGGQGCPIYEEFTFNEAGEITFVEAWSDAAASLPMDAATDRWAEGEDVARLSTRIPGLGDAEGAIDPTGAAMTAAAASDPDVADFAARAQDFWPSWSAELEAAGDDLYARGCGW